MNRFVLGTVVILIPVANVTLSSKIVFAQDKGGGGGAGPAGGGGTTTAQPAPSVQYYPGGVAPTPAGQPLGGGNTGDYGKFDYGRGGGGKSTMYGNESGSADLGGGLGPGGDTVTLGGGIEGNLGADSHVVRKGDTLWGICDYYFRNPYQWPRIWSFNPQIQNPHWIYPGDLIRLKTGGQLPTSQQQQQSTTGPSMVDRRRQVVPDTIFLRDTGFIDDTDKDNWGEVSGANIDKMFLTDTDEIYMHVPEGHDPKVGQELTVFRPIRAVPGGRLVQIEGSVRVDRWDPKTRTARGQITETLDVIERGARIGPVGRKFKVVPPVRNETELKAAIIASIYPHSFYGQNQVVFIDKGHDDGLKPGNRLFIMRRGDDWRRTLKSDIAGKRLDHQSEKPSDTEAVPKFPASDMPEEVIGEIRILETRPHNAAALVTRSIRELERDDTAVMRKGY